MFQNVRHAGTVAHGSSEGDREEVVGIIVVEMNESCSRFDMSENVSCGVKFRYLLNTFHSETANFGIQPDVLRRDSVLSHIVYPFCSLLEWLSSLYLDYSI